MKDIKETNNNIPKENKSQSKMDSQIKMEDHEALAYLRNIMKRDSKPTNPEKCIMVKLFD
jgi:hypothetical protein